MFLVMKQNLNSLYRCTRTRVPRRLLSVGDVFSIGFVRRDSVIPRFIRKVVFIDYANLYLIDHFGCRFSLTGSDVLVCVPR